MHLVAQLQADVVAKAEAAAMWQTRDELLGLQLQQAHERIRALEAPCEPDPSPAALGHATDGLPVETVSESATPGRPWWRFWG